MKKNSEQLYKVVLVNCGNNKQHVLNKIALFSELGFIDIINLSKSLPKTIQYGLDKRETDLVEKIFTSAGATVEILEDHESLAKHSALFGDEQGLKNSICPSCGSSDISIHNKRFRKPHNVCGNCSYKWKRNEK